MVDRPLMHGIGWPAEGDPAVCTVRRLIGAHLVLRPGRTPSGQAANRCEGQAVTDGTRPPGRPAIATAAGRPAGRHHSITTTQPTYYLSAALSGQQGFRNI